MKLKIKRTKQLSGLAPMSFDRPIEPEPGAPLILAEKATQYRGAGTMLVAPDRSRFWDRYDRARSEVELLGVPPAAIATIVGPIEHVEPLINRLSRPDGSNDVIVHTKRPHLAAPHWTVTEDPVQMVLNARCDDLVSPLFVVDLPDGIEVWLRPLVNALRDAGVGLVHYVLPGQPSDEDLASWHGEIGRPAVAELTSPIDPARALELIERGEPISAIAGRPITAGLLMALRSEVGK